MSIGRSTARDLGRSANVPPERARKAEAFRWETASHAGRFVILAVMLHVLPIISREFLRWPSNSTLCAVNRSDLPDLAARRLRRVSHRRTKRGGHADPPMPITRGRIQRRAPALFACRHLVRGPYLTRVSTAADHAARPAGRRARC